MEALLLSIYALCAWLVFGKFKLLPWNTVSKVVTFTIPVVAMAWLIFMLNVFAPSSSDVRVITPSVQVIPLVKGRVVSVDVVSNQQVKKGDVLFRIDPAPFEQKVRELTAQLKVAETAAENMKGDVQSANANTVSAQSRLDQAQAKLILAQQRVREHQALVNSGAGDVFALEQAQTDLRLALGEVKSVQGDVVARRTNEIQVKNKLNTRVGNEVAGVAVARAQLAQAEWELAQTVVYAPADGYPVNVQIREGMIIGNIAATFAPALTFIENEYRILAFYNQNELHAVKVGDRAEFTLESLPGRIIHAKVHSIILNNAEGQILPTGAVPDTGRQLSSSPGQRFAVRYEVVGDDKSLMLPSGAQGDGAVYTDSWHAIHVVRMVILRIGAKLNYLIFKLH